MKETSWRSLAIELLTKRTLSMEESSFLLKKRKRVRINDRIQLTEFDKVREASFRWYQDPEAMRNIVGVRISYTPEQIQAMYEWQNTHGELYYIERVEGKKVTTIGDVWLAEDDYAIVLDQAYQHQHIGRIVTRYFIHKSKKMGREFITVSEIFNWNKASQKMFTGLKFYPYQQQSDSWSYRKRLRKKHKYE